MNSSSSPTPDQNVHPRLYPSLKNIPFSWILGEKKPTPFSSEIADFEVQ